MREGNLLKFRQNQKLLDLLLATGDNVLVEASPRDKIWGIGMGEKKARTIAGGEEEKKWGLNLLGVALMETRDLLRREQI